MNCTRNIGMDLLNGNFDVILLEFLPGILSFSCRMTDFFILVAKCRFICPFSNGVVCLNMLSMQNLHDFNILEKFK